MDENITVPVYDIVANSATLGLTVGDYSFLMGLTGVFIGFTFTYFTVYTIVNIAKRNY